jgi:signal transduction histidine kinase
VTRPLLLRFGLLFGGASIVALAFASSSYAMYALKGEPIDWRMPVTWAFGEWWGYALLAPAVAWLARRARVADGARTDAHVGVGPRGAALLLAGWAGFLLASQALYVAFERGLGMAGSLGQLSYGRQLLVHLPKRGPFTLLVFAAIVGAVWALDLYRRYRERELRASQLEARLARAQLDALRQQLHPHFLFNTLNTISALMHRDVEAADRVVTRLGDLLRMGLQRSSRQEIALREELDFLERYVEIQRTRFQDRLTVAIEAEPEALDLLVPSLVLQPLVENAVRHAVEPRVEPGRVEVRARREDGRLVLTVADDGPGIVAEACASASTKGCGVGLANRAEGEVGGTHASTKGCGVGLANTKARLEQLYGEAHRFVLANREGGGLEVRLELPLRAGPLPTPTPGLSAGGDGRPAAEDREPEHTHA